MSTYYTGIALFLFILFALTLFARQASRREQVSKSFDLLRPAGELLPEHLGFRVVSPEEEANPEEHSDLTLRPFYESVYVSRLATPYELRAEEYPAPLYDEEDLVDYLRGGQGFVLIGPPADGKTRTLYKVVKQMDGYEVLTLKVDEKIPEKSDLSFLFKEKKVILLLDDLEYHKDRKKDLLTLEDRLSECEIPWVVASTSQDGSELATAQRELGRLYDRISLELWLVAATPQQKRQLYQSISNEPWNPERGEDYPTLGSIAMENAMRAMKRRFRDLSHSRPDHADILRALKLLEYAGLPLTHKLLRAVLGHEQLFAHSNAHFLPQSLRVLANEGFLPSASTDPVKPEPAYLRNCVTYIPGKTLEGDLDKLADLLEELKDAEGLLALGITCSDKLEAQERAIPYFNRALQLRACVRRQIYGEIN